ncbi:MULTISPECIES: sodium-dependent transporter [unclassified Anaerobiospirillum]|uniref:sodium-dependent transporter n=1 Tax=unclassified Anaerobiospirillum TaxID=2647410 RepID=UPI001FF1B68D|nr:MULTISPECIES: sodium-dependent transporter [unclassified Anaerobiospirillum]MCK0525738.1 sodium-dependent transporter [Anaerobiospirillum sp. NML120449]MCK0534475.1 sodium-dependent transporter [Anaerobiospirillum sp. NML120511]MCK0539727.1 sodium-dependent transporter [Anaerobiospirillum sp. NML02-A-032]
MSQREQFSSRLGFLLIAAGCAIGLGNVWRFPYITGQYGGAIFVLMYLFFLLLLGVPLLTLELSVGRASRRSVARAFEILEQPGSRWHWNKFWMIPGSYILMSFYGVITGWLLYYMLRTATGFFPEGTTQQTAGMRFEELLASPYIMFACMMSVAFIAFSIVALGVVKGVERITKPLMLVLFALLIFMAVRSVSLPGFAEGISYYLNPSWDSVQKHGFMQAMWAAMGQVFFTLSVGQGSIEIFGTYMDKRHSLTSEAILICILDTTVALLAGFVIFPACFSFDIEPGAGPSLLFVTLTTVFSNMEFGIFWGTLFFLFMLFAALSTLIAVFESIISMTMDLFTISRVKAVIYNFAIITVMSIPCILGFNVLKDFHPLGGQTVIMDLQDFIVSNNVLPIGSLVFLLFITAKSGMGFKRYREECNTGSGPKIPEWTLWYFKYVLPVVIAVILVVGYYNIFFL